MISFSMKHIFKGVGVFFVCFFLTISFVYFDTVLAKKSQDTTKIKVHLSEKYSWKKLDALKKSIKHNDSYEIVISSSSLKELQDIFWKKSKKIKFKKVWNTLYNISIPNCTNIYFILNKIYDSKTLGYICGSGSNILPLT